MKFILTFKTPYAMEQAIDPYIDTHCEQCTDEFSRDCDACEREEDRCCVAIQKIQTCAANFILYGETIRVEFDTDANTATVLPAEYGR